MNPSLRSFSKQPLENFSHRSNIGKKEPTTIAGLYDLGETIGKGHYAVVKEAHHVFTGEKVAVKVIDKTKLDEVSKVHLIQEVRCMKLVQHPNVVKLYQVIDTQSKLYLILEFADGGDLYDYIMKQGCGLDEEAAKSYFSQIVSAIDFCHRLHVVHRDLKPENVVFFKNQKIVKLTDFGFSNKFVPGNKLDTSCGSLAYSAPEILLGDSYDAPAVDVWSLGVILYMLVSGQAPFLEANDSETLTMIMDCKYLVPTHVNPLCKQLITKMLVKEPTERASLQWIISHPWLTDFQSKIKSPEVPLVCQEALETEDHERVIQKMVSANLASIQDITDSLQSQAYNHITATYYLLAERHLKKKFSSVSSPSHNPLPPPTLPHQLSPDASMPSLLPLALSPRSTSPVAEMAEIKKNCSSIPLECLVSPPTSSFLHSSSSSFSPFRKINSTSSIITMNKNNNNTLDKDSLSEKFSNFLKPLNIKKINKPTLTSSSYYSSSSSSSFNSSSSSLSPSSSNSISSYIKVTSYSRPLSNVFSSPQLNQIHEEEDDEGEAEEDENNNTIKKNLFDNKFDIFTESEDKEESNETKKVMKSEKINYKVPERGRKNKKIIIDSSSPSSSFCSHIFSSPCSKTKDCNSTSNSSSSSSSSSSSQSKPQKYLASRCRGPPELSRRDSSEHSSDTDSTGTAFHGGFRKRNCNKNFSSKINSDKDNEKKEKNKNQVKEEVNKEDYEILKNSCCNNLHCLGSHIHQCKNLDSSPGRCHRRRRPPRATKNSFFRIHLNCFEEDEGEESDEEDYLINILKNNNIINNNINNQINNNYSNNRKKNCNTNVTEDCFVSNTFPLNKNYVNNNNLSKLNLDKDILFSQNSTTIETKLDTMSMKKNKNNFKNNNFLIKNKLVSRNTMIIKNNICANDNDNNNNMSYINDKNNSENIRIPFICSGNEVSIKQNNLFEKFKYLPLTSSTTSSLSPLIFHLPTSLSYSSSFSNLFTCSSQSNFSSNKLSLTCNSPFYSSFPSFPLSFS